MKRVFLHIFCLFLVLAESSGQDNTLYHQYGIPQSIFTNPAIQPACRIYIELPVISSIGFAYDNSGFGYNDAISHGEGIRADSLGIDFNQLEKTPAEKEPDQRNCLDQSYGCRFLCEGAIYSF